MNRKAFLAVTAMALSVAAQAYTLSRASVHDPSVVWEPTTQTYYIFGSHRAMASTQDMMNWNQPWGYTWTWAAGTSTNAANVAAFTTPEVKKVKKGGVEVDFPQFNAYNWSAAVAQVGDGKWGIDGNMWAPDVIYNKAMKKWCMYMSINGLQWNSSIILLTADKITGPYRYQGPVVISGFNVTSNSAIDYKKTDLELAIGTQSSLPSRYARGDKWGTFLPHCIDPCVFYDEQGRLWMSYGSWSNGIWMLELDEETGLRDYNVDYGDDSSRGFRQSKDPYFGKKIAGSAYVSGEASYIEYIGGYYHLFVSYGGLNSVGGYQMRVFRSTNPDGPYTDAAGQSAIYNNYVMNYGPKDTEHRGVNIFGAYGSWGNMNNAELAQGHNSIIAADDGRTYLVYHTRFKNGMDGNLEAHQVRVHQVFQNKDGWLVAAPFEYTGEAVKSADIATTQQIAVDRIPGNYKLLIHRYGLNYENREVVVPVSVQLNADGTITGIRSGTWAIEEGTSYITLKVTGVEYKGVLVEQTLEPSNDKVVAFTALATSGVTAWGYREKDLPEAPANADIATGRVAYYNFNASPIVNQDNQTQTVTLQKEGNNSAPSLVNNGYKGRGLQTKFGAAGNTSNAKFQNPLYGSALTDGLTVSMWTNVLFENLWDALFSFYNTQTTGRLYMTPNTYLGFNDMAGRWIDLNHPTNVTTDYLSFGSWNHVVLTVSRTEGVKIYVNGELKEIKANNSDKFNNDYNLIVDFVRQATDFYFGFGSFWGSLDAIYDELVIYDRPLTADDVLGLYVKTLQSDYATGIDEVQRPTMTEEQIVNGVFNLRGQRVATPTKGVYIKGGKKVMMK